jgi:predicted Zn-dependent protease
MGDIRIQHAARRGLLLSAAALFAADPIEAVFEKAVAALAAQDYVAAERGFVTVLKTKPDNIGALGNLGVVYTRTHRYAMAINVYNRALVKAPSDPGLLLNLGLAYMKQEQYPKALPVLVKLVKMNPENRQARELLVTCQLYTGRLQTALASFESLRAKDPRNTGVLYLLALTYYRLKQPENAGAILTDLLNSAPPAEANLLIGKAQYEAGHFEESAGSFRTSLLADPRLPTVHRELGKVLISLHQNADAEKELSLAIRQDREDGEAYYFLGALELQEHKLDAAGAYLETARELLPDSWAVYFYLGRLRQQEAKPAEAVTLLQRAARLNPVESSIYYRLAQALKSAGREAESRAVLQRVKDLKAKDLQRDAIPAP